MKTYNYSDLLEFIEENIKSKNLIDMCVYRLIMEEEMISSNLYVNDWLEPTEFMQGLLNILGFTISFDGKETYTLTPIN